MAKSKRIIALFLAILVIAGTLSTSVYAATSVSCKGKKNTLYATTSNSLLNLVSPTKLTIKITNTSELYYTGNSKLAGVSKSDISRVQVTVYKKSGSSWKKADTYKLRCKLNGTLEEKISLSGRKAQYKIVVEPLITDMACILSVGDSKTTIANNFAFNASVSTGSIRK